jgi:hypothetical protein
MNPGFSNSVEELVDFGRSALVKELTKESQRAEDG